MNKLETDWGGLSNDKIYGINDHLIINKYSEFLQKNFKLKVSQDNNNLPCTLEFQAAQKSCKC